MSAYIATYEGHRLDLLHPDPSKITIEGIARGLSRECRFHNQTLMVYSVAQHSIEVAMLCQGREAQLWGLLHDAGEAYYRDLASLLKHELGGFWKAMEHAWLLMLATKFSLPLPIPKEVKQADKIMLAVERRLLLPQNEEIDRQFEFNESGLTVPDRHLKIMNCYEAELSYLTMFDRLYDKPKYNIA